MVKNIVFDDKLYRLNDILLVKNCIRRTDLVKIVDILFNINTEKFVFRVGSLEYKEFYYIDKSDILGKVELLKGVDFNDFK